MKKILLLLIPFASLGQVKISDMPSATDLSGTLFYPIIQNGVNKKVTPYTFTAPLSLSGLTLSMPPATTSVSGYLTSTDWTTFNNKLNINGSNANTDIDIGNFNLSAKGFRTTGTAGSGDIHLKFQSADATGTGSSSSLWADATGNLNWKIDGLYKSTFSTSANTANRTYTLQNHSGVVITTGVTSESVIDIDGDGTNSFNIGTGTEFNQISMIANYTQLASGSLTLTDTGGGGVAIQNYISLNPVSSAPFDAVDGGFWYNSTDGVYQGKIAGNVLSFSTSNYYAPKTLVSNATDADFTATVNGVHNILDGVATTNRVITIPTGANGDVMKFYNTEDTRVWSLTGASVYLADRVTVVTQLLYNVPCHMEKIDGIWIITN